MGMIWRFAMPLLSTLAALVIIVHSAEEDLEQEFRYDLRPRALNTEPASYEQPWRVVKSAPVMKHASENVWSQDSQEEQPKRRRKRKRRPIDISGEDLATQERYTYPESPPKVNQDADYENVYQTTDMPRRRRKRINARTNRWADEAIEAERPIRRRGNRRKRPALEKWPKLSEFPDQPEDSYENPSDELNNKNPDPGYIEYSEAAIKEPDADTVLKDILLQKPNGYNDKRSKNNMQDDKSLSEFSMESFASYEKPKTREKIIDEHLLEIKNQKEEIEVLYKELTSKIKSILTRKLFKLVDRDFNYDGYYLKKHIRDIKCAYKTNSDLPNPLSYNTTNMPKKYRILRTGMSLKNISEDSNPSDDNDHPCLNERRSAPLTLKDILKQSNGSSLSEILQQHNLTLADLLHDQEKAVTILKSQDTIVRRKDIDTAAVTETSGSTKTTEIEALESKNPLSVNSKLKVDTENNTVINRHQYVQTEENKESEAVTDQIEKESSTNKPNSVRYMNRRPFPTGMRKKLRLRPMINNTFKSPLSRDMASLGLKRFPNRRNITKSQKWKSMIPFLGKSQLINETYISENDTDITTTTTTMPTTTSVTFDETTIVIDFDKPDPEVIPSMVDEKISYENNSYIEISSTDLTEAPITTSESPTTIVTFNITEKPIVTPIVRQLNASSIRRSAFNNRLKKKRLKQKNSTTETPENNVIKNLVGLGSLVSSSEFITKTTTVKQTSREDDQEIDALEDFMTTAVSRNTESSTSPTQASMTSIRPSTTTKFTSPWRPTEETAEIEIKELLNDTQTSAKLSKILMDRNMTLNELVEHRERGSSHVHLADIFHNASREPNPPEPFLSKSLIEPISKETYPLRALLDANIHDPTVKATTIDPTLSQTNLIQNIPVVMDFGNNVNENAENMGIMSLFKNFTNSTGGSHTTTTVHDSELEPHETNSLIINTTTDDGNHRESRTLNDNQDMVSWNDIFSMIRKHNKNETEQTENYYKDVSPSVTYKKIILEEDVDGDGVIVLEDLQHLKDFDSNIASDEKLEIFEREGTRKPSVLNIPGNTKSVTVATASIVGLSMVLFLLTYAAFKWIQQKKKEKKRNFPSERIPTPVFENRKGHKNNSSTRSISPMLSSSNIYTMNTLESHHGKDSPEYMWDTLRKPFQ